MGLNKVSSTYTAAQKTAVNTDITDIVAVFDATATVEITDGEKPIYDANGVDVGREPYVADWFENDLFANPALHPKNFNAVELGKDWEFAKDNDKMVASLEAATIKPRTFSKVAKAECFMEFRRWYNNLDQEIKDGTPGAREMKAKYAPLFAQENTEPPVTPPVV